MMQSIKIKTSDDDRCPISLKRLTKLDQDKKVVLHPCNHQFSSKHFIQYCTLYQYKTCPVCRQRFTHVYNVGTGGLILHNPTDDSFLPQSFSKFMDSIKSKLICCLCFAPSESV